jgi:hypothetical protein
MNKIPTEEHLVNALNKDIAWRKVEISKLKQKLESFDKNHEAYKVWLKCSIVLLYAHWESFVKNAAIAYLSFLSTRQIQFSQLNMPLQALVLKNTHYQDVTIKKTIGYQKILTTINANEAVKHLFINCEKWINTEANLNSENFKEIFQSLGLDLNNEYTKNYSSKEHFIDAVLLQHRNEVAHQADLYVNKNDLKSLKQDIFSILELVENFKTDVENAAIQQSYLKP